MSEARDYFEEYGGARSNVARLRFAANETLQEHLEAFYGQSYVTTLGRGALFLYSEQSMRYVDERQRLVQYDYMQDMAGLQEIDDLQNSLKHRAYGQRRLAPSVEFKRLPDHDPGMLIRMSVIIDELTARVLRDTVFMEDGRTVRVGVRIPLPHLDGGARLLAARDELVEGLETGQRLMAVDSLELISRQQRR